MPLSEGKTPCFAYLKRSLAPGREKLSTSVAGRHPDARRHCGIPPRARHTGRRTTVPRFEWQIKEEILIDFWQASPP